MYIVDYVLMEYRLRCEQRDCGAVTAIIIHMGQQPMARRKMCVCADRWYLFRFLVDHCGILTPTNILFARFKICTVEALLCVGPKETYGK